MGRLGSWMTPFLAARSQLIPNTPLDVLGLFAPEYIGPPVDRLPESLSAHIKPMTFCRALTREAAVGETIMLDLSGDHNDLFNVTIPGWMNPDSSQISIYELKTLTKVPAHLLFTCDAPGMFDLYFGVLTSDTVKKLWGLTFSVCRANIACLDSLAQVPTSYPTQDFQSTEFTIDIPLAALDFSTTAAPTTTAFRSSERTSPTTTTPPSSSTDMMQTSARAEVATAQSVTALTAQTISQFRQNLDPGALEAPAATGVTETQRRVVAVGTHRHNHGPSRSTSTTTTSPPNAMIPEPAVNSGPASLVASVAAVGSGDQAVLKKPPGVPQEAWDWFLTTRGNRSHNSRNETAISSRTETTPPPRTILIREVVVPSPASEIIVVSDLDASGAVGSNKTAQSPSSNAPVNKLLPRLRKDKAATVSHPILHRRGNSPEGEEYSDDMDEDDSDTFPPQISVRAPPGALNVYLEPAPINPEIVQRLTEEANDQWYGR